jgi:hypothetical protein
VLDQVIETGFFCWVSGWVPGWVSLVLYNGTIAISFSWTGGQMAVWEYCKLVELIGAPDTDLVIVEPDTSQVRIDRAGSTLSALARMGRLGWELVSVTPVWTSSHAPDAATSDATISGREFFLKREGPST